METTVGVSRTVTVQLLTARQGTEVMMETIVTIAASAPNAAKAVTGTAQQVARRGAAEVSAPRHVRRVAVLAVVEAAALAVRHVAGDNTVFF